MVAQTDVETIRLGPLDQTSTHELVVDATEGAPLRPHTIEAIVDRTGGNPLFVEEILRSVRTSGDEADLPESLDDLVGAQIDALPPVARRLLQYASVLGRGFPRWLLEDVVADERLHLDSATSDAPEAFQIPEGHRCPLPACGVRDGGAYERLSASKDAATSTCGRRCRRAADAAIPEQPRTAPDLHFALGSETAKAWRYSRVAGDRARSAYANIEAGAHYERALDAARQDPDVPDADTGEVWTSLGFVQELAGLYRDALESLAHAMSLQPDEAGRAKLRLLRAQVLQRTSSFRSALREASTATKLIEADQGDHAQRLRVQLLAFRAFVRQAQQRPLEALRQAQLVVIEAREIDERAALAGAYGVLDWAHLMLGRPSDRRSCPTRWRSTRSSRTSRVRRAC